MITSVHTNTTKEEQHEGAVPPHKDLPGTLFPDHKMEAAQFRSLFLKDLRKSTVRSASMEETPHRSDHHQSMPSLCLKKIPHTHVNSPNLTSWPPNPHHYKDQVNQRAPAHGADFTATPACTLQPCRPVPETSSSNVIRIALVNKFLAHREPPTQRPSTQKTLNLVGYGKQPRY